MTAGSEISRRQAFVFGALGGLGAAAVVAAVLGVATAARLLVEGRRG